MLFIIKHQVSCNDLKIIEYFTSTNTNFLFSFSDHQLYFEFCCKTCNRRYQSDYARNRHERYECGVLPRYPCPLCEFRATYRYNLVKHIRNIHKSAMK